MSLEPDKSRIPGFIPQDLGVSRSGRRDNPFKSSGLDRRAADLRHDGFSAPRATDKRILHRAPDDQRARFHTLQLFAGDDARPVEDLGTGRALGRAMAHLDRNNMNTLGMH